MPSTEFPETGWLAFPWLLALPGVMLISIYLYGNRVNLRAALLGRLPARNTWLVYVVLFGYSALVLFTPKFDPIQPGNVQAAGPGIESVAGGHVYAPDEDSIFESGPLYRAAIGPGEKFQVLASIRNEGPLPITLLGPLDTGFDTTAPDVDYFLSAIWIAPNAENFVFPLSTDLVPFAPIGLGPGEQVALVLEYTGGSCAFPGPGGFESRGMLGSPYVYEIWWWRRVGYVWPRYELGVRAQGPCTPR